MDKITVDFLKNEGWVVSEEFPLHTSFKHSKNNRLRCSISVYHGFSICELHWCNDTAERHFFTTNCNLTTDDYNNIVRMLAISL